MSYRLLVLPRVPTMTPRLLKKIDDLVQAGATVVGNPPRRSPSLVGYPECDREVADLAAKVWKSPRVHPDTMVKTPEVDLGSAKWIWTAEGDPATAAPVATHTFSRNFDLPAARPLASANLAFTADNSFRLFVNGKRVLTGSDFHRIGVVDVAGLLKVGRNVLTAEVTNEGTSPNPAGLLGTIDVRFKDGGQKTVVSTDETWQDESGNNAKTLGEWTMGPWGLSTGNLPRPELYPGYAATAAILQGDLKTVPDLDATDALRYSHRKIGTLDAYFVANRSEKPYEGLPTFRVAGAQPEWWDPMTGETRPLPSFAAHRATTTIPLRFEGLQSGFVIFRPDATAKATNGENFPRLQPVATLEGAWNVAFDPRFGGSASTTFSELSDWKENADPAIRFYSGKAVYVKRFDLDYVGSGPYTLSLGDVKNMASVTLNGHDLGIAWCAPWRLSIPAGVLKASGNVIQITVANLWTNRLIGDAGLPESQRKAQTTWSPFTLDSPLQPSGLLGPVRIESTEPSSR